MNFEAINGKPSEEIPKEKKELNLTEDQKNGENYILEWLHRENKTGEDYFCSLTGSAGTGKTTLISSIVKKLEWPYKNRTCVSAPTHKARKIISQKSGCSESETVQSLLGLKPDVNLENFDVNEPLFSAIGTKKMSTYKLLIIDESSMVNADLYKTIHDDAINFRVKVLFIGDLKQLPPIEKSVDSFNSIAKEVLSKTLLDPINKYNLTQIVRQEYTNPLVDLLGILTDDIDNKTNNYLKFMDENPVRELNDEGYRVLIGKEEVREASLEIFGKSRNSEDKNFVRYITWTNDSVRAFNQFIRKEHLVTEDRLILNESLLSYSSVPDGTGLGFSIVNSEDYFVTKIEEFEDGYGILIWKTSLTETDSDRKSYIKIVIPTPENYDKYLKQRQIRLDNALIRKGKAWKEYYIFRESYCLLDDLMQGKTKVDKKNIDYGYGITIHKSQGSTFENVIINGKDINKHPNDIEKRKLWYVALSRASKKAYIIL